MKKNTVKKGKAKTSKRRPSGKVSAVLFQNARNQNAITCQIMEYKQLQAIEAELGGQLTDKFAYEFKQDGQTIRGIRAGGVRECVRFCGVKPYNFIPKFDYKTDDLGDGYYREIVTCINPHTKETTRGTAQWKRGDRFSDRIAQTNAERNALLKQIPAQMQLQFINYCRKKGFIKIENVDPTLPENKEATKALGAPNAPDNKTALITRIYAIFGAMNIDSKKARLWLHKRYKVESVKDLSEEVLNRIIIGLRNVENNAPGKCAKPNTNEMTPEELKEDVEKGE